MGGAFSFSSFFLSRFKYKATPSEVSSSAVVIKSVSKKGLFVRKQVKNVRQFKHYFVKIKQILDNFYHYLPNRNKIWQKYIRSIGWAASKKFNLCFCRPNLLPARAGIFVQSR